MNNRETARRKFAFLVHPRTDVRKDLAMIHPPLGLIPNRVYDYALRNLPLPPISIGEVRFNDRPDDTAGWIILIPYSARQMIELGRSNVFPKIEAAVDKAVALGAEVVGLGALTAPVSRGGAMLKGRNDVAVTNGNAFTAAMTFEGIKRLLPTVKMRSGRRIPTIALVGATGSVGSCTARLLVRHGIRCSLTLIARTVAPLNTLAEELRRDSPATPVATSADMTAVRDADLVVLMTSAAGSLLGPEHLKQGAVVLDDTQPRNTDPSLEQTRPDVLIVDGGIVAIPGIDLGTDVGAPPGCAYACLAETMLLALDGADRHFSIGAPTVEQADRIAETAGRFRRFGFNLAPFSSFGKPIEQTTTNQRPAASIPAAAVLHAHAIEGGL